MARKKPPKKTSRDDFKSLARRLGCDEDKAAFEAKIGKIARAKGVGTKLPRKK